MPVGDVRRFETELLDNLRRNHKGILDEIRETKDFSSDNEERLVAAIEKFKKDFTATDGSRVVNEAKASALDADKVGAESVKVNRPDPAKK